MRNLFKIIVPILFVLVTVLPFAQSNAVEAASKYADGEHDLPFTVLKGDSDESSMTNDYLVSPAKLIVENGKNIVQLTLKNSSWWEDFTVASGSVSEISEANDTRVVQFEVGDLDQILDSKIHVIVPDIDYDNKYDVRFQFDTSGLTANEGDGDADEGNEDNDEKETDKENGNGNGSNNSETDGDEVSTGGKAEENPPTGDSAPILLLSVVLLGSGFLLVRKFAVR